MFDNSDELRKAFEDLDEQNYWPFADALVSYRDALVTKGFTRDEAFILVKKYAKYLYEWALEESLGTQNDELPEGGDDLENT